MDGIDHAQIDLQITGLLEQLSLSLENISRSINESPGARSEAIRVMREAASKTSQNRSTHMSMADETAQVCHNLHNTVVELNDYIFETDRKMIASANVITEGIKELKKDREESTKLFNELMINLRDIGQETNLLEVRNKIDYVNQWLKERTVVIDETMKGERKATGFDQSVAPGREQDVLNLRNGSEEDTEGSRKRQKLGHEESRSSSQSSSSTARDKFSVLLVECDTFDRLFNKKQIIEFGREYNLGIEVKVAKNGEQVIDLHHQGASFDLILMDMDMPASVTSGYEATTQLRSCFGVKSNIVGLTSTPVSKDINEFIRAGHLNGCIGKPLTDEKIDSLLPIPKGNN